MLGVGTIVLALGSHEHCEAKGLADPNEPMEAAGHEGHGHRLLYLSPY